MSTEFQCLVLELGNQQRCPDNAIISPWLIGSRIMAACNDDRSTAPPRANRRWLGGVGTRQSRPYGDAAIFGYFYSFLPASNPSETISCWVIRRTSSRVV